MRIDLVSNYEILVVDDGSSDGSLKCLDQIGEAIPALRVIAHERNRGYGAALTTGFRNASREWVFYTDGDGQYRVGDLRRLVDVLEDGVDVVNGFKTDRADPWYRTAVGLLYRVCFHVLFRFPVRDVTCDFRLIRRSLVGNMPLLSTSGAICVELITRLRLAGAVFREVGVGHHAREHGRSQFFRPGRIARSLVEVMVVWWKVIVRSEGECHDS